MNLRKLRCQVVVAHDIAGVLFFDGPWRRGSGGRTTRPRLVVPTLPDLPSPSDDGDDQLASLKKAIPAIAATWRQLDGHIL